jgi:hypothetical protein
LLKRLKDRNEEGLVLESKKVSGSLTYWVKLTDDTHPSDIAEPSSADRGITTRIKDALEVFDIDVLDHFVVTSGECCSFADRGWM